MLLRRWDELPEFMQTEEVKPYYDVLDKKRGQLLLKRCFDVFASLTLIIVLSPVMIFVTIWIKSDSQGSIFFRQERVTQYGEIFRIYKFRTMVENAEQLGSSVTIKEDCRITKVGKKIRNCRLDEIPQLFNVFLGEMSFVGTRPEVKKYVDAYKDEMYATLLLPAGVTSNASIAYKNEDELLGSYININDAYIKIVVPLKMEINLYNILNFTFLGDLKTCFKTLK